MGNDKEIKELAAARYIMLAFFSPTSMPGTHWSQLSCTLTTHNTRSHRVVVKEGAKYKVRVVFRVQNEPVLGLKLVQKVYKMGLNGELPWHSPHHAWP